MSLQYAKQLAGGASNGIVPAVVVSAGRLRARWEDGDALDY